MTILSSDQYATIIGGYNQNGYDVCGVEKAAQRDLSEWRAVATKRGRSVAAELELGKARHSSTFDELISTQTKRLSDAEEYDKEQEVRGYYRTARVAEILKCNREWLEFAVDCGIIKGRARHSEKGQGPSNVIVKLADVQAWLASKYEEA
jgi:hypothetical protein